VFVVIEDHPDHRDVVLDRRHELEARQCVAAVATTDDDRAFGVGYLQPERTVDVTGHRSEAARLAEVLALLQFDLVADPGCVGASVGQQRRVRGQHLPISWASCPGWMWCVPWTIRRAS